MISDQGPDQLLAIRHVCELLGISRRTLYNWMERKLVIAKYTPGGAPRFRRGDLLLLGKPNKAAVPPCPTANRLPLATGGKR